MSFQVHLTEEASIGETSSTAHTEVFDRLLDRLGVVCFVHETVTMQTQCIDLKIPLVLEDLLQLKNLIVHLVNDCVITGTIRVFLELLHVDLQVPQAKPPLRSLLNVLLHVDFLGK